MDLNVLLHYRFRTCLEDFVLVGVGNENIIYKYIGATGPAGLDGVIGRNGTSELAVQGLRKWNIRN
jgi:hypothetical protein